MSVPLSEKQKQPWVRPLIYYSTTDFQVTQRFSRENSEEHWPSGFADPQWNVKSRSPDARLYPFRTPPLDQCLVLWQFRFFKSSPRCLWKASGPETQYVKHQLKWVERDTCSRVSTQVAHWYARIWKESLKMHREDQLSSGKPMKVTTAHKTAHGNYEASYMKNDCQRASALLVTLHPFLQRQVSPTHPEWKDSTAVNHLLSPIKSQSGRKYSRKTFYT